MPAISTVALAHHRTYLVPMEARHTDLPHDVRDMIDDFAFLADWEERYMHVIDMGKALPALGLDEKIDAHKVKGCVSQVWLISQC